MTERWHDGPDTFDSGEPVDPVGAALWRLAIRVRARLRRRRRGV